ncbi:MAG: GatB/YqeY domain-containing protein [Candidatus Saccharimonadales bacterium]
MALKQQLDADIKQAMLGGDRTLTETLRGLKSAILYAEVAKGKRETGLEDSEIIDVLSKESKKRQESADLYKQGGNEEKAQAELAEKEIIQKYLPEQLSEDDIKKLVDEVIASQGEVNPQMMGQIIGQVKQKAGASADGAVIARIVKDRL